jgi:hypothetical protein
MSTLKSKRILAALAVAVVGVAVGGAAIASAQTDTDSPRAFFDAVAKHLGISSEELEDATKAAAIDQVDAALEEGRITEEQAERLKERIESGDGVPFFGPRFGFHGGMHLRAPGDQLAAAADYLGLSVAQLRERLRDGHSLADVARAENKSVDGLEQAMLDAVEKKLDEAVDDGDLTRAQADRMLEHIQSHIDEIVNGSVGEWRFHRFGGRPRQAPPAGAEFWGAAV